MSSPLLDAALTIGPIALAVGAALWVVVIGKRHLTYLRTGYRAGQSARAGVAVRNGARAAH